MKILRILSCFTAFLWFCAGVAHATIVTPEGVRSEVAWTEEDMAKEVALKTVIDTGNASHHAIRLNTAEKPHSHREHDAVVFLLKGQVKIHLGDKSFTVEKGDILWIPRGVVHWAENVSKEPVEAYAIFTPSYDGTDILFIGAEADAGAPPAEPEILDEATKASGEKLE